MSRFETSSSANGGRLARRQQGQTLMATLGVITVLGVLVAGGLRISNSSKTAAARDTRSELALEAADAAVQRYISRLVEDPLYATKFVDEAEDPRTNALGAAMPKAAAPATSTPWDGSLNWSYAGPVTAWKVLKSGARYGTVDYSIRIKQGDSDLFTITATGRVGSDRPNPLRRTIEVKVRPTSISDFQMISNKDIRYGVSATSRGKLYSNRSLTHQGTALAPVYAQNFVCVTTFPCGGSQATVNPTIFQKGAWDSTTAEKFSDVFRSPIDFTKFTRSLDAIRDAATASGTRYNDPTVSGWLVQFRATGDYYLWKITGAGNLGATMGTLSTKQGPFPVPTSGAMYFDQNVVISDESGITQNRADGSGSKATRSSVVDGRVTVATNGNAYVGGNILYEADYDDVLGIIASGETVITEYTPRTTTIRAAMLAQTGKWRSNNGGGNCPNSDCGDGNHDLLTYTGSTATADGGFMSMFATRNYLYDVTLKSLRPPLYPVLEDSWETEYWREITPLS